MQAVTVRVKQKIADDFNNEKTSLYIEISVKVKSETVSQGNHESLQLLQVGISVRFREIQTEKPTENQRDMKIK